MTTLGTAAHGARAPTGMKVAPKSYGKLKEVANNLHPPHCVFIQCLAGVLPAPQSRK